MAVEVRFTSYGADALAALRDVVAHAKRTDPMAPVTVVVPNNIAGIVARRHLAEYGVNGRPGIAALYVVTLERLAEQLAAVHLHPRRPATAAIVASAWRAALDRSPGVFETVKDHPATIQALVHTHRELRDLSDGELDKVAGVSDLSRAVVRLHKDVVGSLRNGWYDPTDLLREGVRRAADRVDEIGPVVLYLPQRLTLAESAFGRAIAAHHPTTVIAGTSGVRRADNATLESLDRLGADVSKPETEPSVATRVLHASDSDDEVRSVVREVVAALPHTSAHRIAVLYGARIPYARLLHEQLADAGISVNGSGVRPVHERAVARAFLGVLALGERDLPRAELFQALAEAPTLTLSGESVPVSRWERLSRLVGIVAGDDWERRTDYFVRTQRSRIEDEEENDDPNVAVIEHAHRDIASATGLAELATSLRARLAEGLTLTTWSDLSRWSLELFAGLYGAAGEHRSMPTAERAAAEAVERSLEALTTLDQIEPATTLQRMREVLQLDLESQLPRVGTFGTGVYVGPLSAAIGLDADRIFVLGMSEDLYPGRLRQDALLPERVRKQTIELPAERDSIDAKQRHLLAAITAAPAVVVSFPRGDLRRSTQRLPSRFILPTLRDLTGNKELAAGDWDSSPCAQITGAPSYAAGLAAADLPVTAQEWRVRASVGDPQSADEVTAAAREVLVSRRTAVFTRFDGNLAGAEGLPDWAASDQTVSPTALEAYAVCPHAYFVEKMLKVQPLEHPEAAITISRLHVGNLVHEAMDEFIRGCDRLPDYGEAWTADQRQRLQRIGSAKAADYEQRGLTGHPVMWARTRVGLMATLDSILGEDNEQRRRQDAKVICSELAFGKDGVKPVAVPLPAGRRVLMKGSADKVDRRRDGVLVVTDIKTGSKRSFTKLDKDPVVAGTKLQLPVYAYAARQLLRGEDVEAEYWFVLDGQERIGYRLDNEIETLYGRTLDTLVTAIAAGYFPAKAPESVDFSWTRCPYCNPDSVGHSEVRSQWERKRTDPRLADLVRLIDPTALGGGTTP